MIVMIVMKVKIIIKITKTIAYNKILIIITRVIIIIIIIIIKEVINNNNLHNLITIITKIQMILVIIKMVKNNIHHPMKIVITKTMIITKIALMIVLKKIITIIIEKIPIKTNINKDLLKNLRVELIKIRVIKVYYNNKFSITTKT